MGYPVTEPRPRVKQGMAITSLVLGVIGLPTLGCLGIGALAGVVLGIVALVRANREPEVYGGKGFAIGGIAASALSLLVAIPVGGIIAAIAIPSVLRAKASANESGTIGDIRTVISAEAAYQSVSGGYYGPLDCLGQPATCIPGYAGPAFLDTRLSSGATKNNYVRTFHPGASVTATADGGPVPARSLESFAYVAMPMEQGKTGVRGFCGDSSGRICFTTDGRAPAVINGICDPGCQELR